MNEIIVAIIGSVSIIIVGIIGIVIVWKEELKKGEGK